MPASEKKLEIGEYSHTTREGQMRYYAGKKKGADGVLRRRYADSAPKARALHAGKAKKATATTKAYKVGQGVAKKSGENKGKMRYFAYRRKSKTTNKMVNVWKKTKALAEKAAIAHAKRKGKKTEARISGPLKKTAAALKRKLATRLTAEDRALAAKASAAVVKLAKAGKLSTLKKKKTPAKKKTGKRAPSGYNLFVKDYHKKHPTKPMTDGVAAYKNLSDSTRAAWKVKAKRAAGK